MSLLQPPVLDAQAYAIPYELSADGNTYDIPFVMPSANSLDDIKHIQVSIKYASTNESAVNENLSPDRSVLYFGVAGVKAGTNPFFEKKEGYYILKIPYDAFDGGRPALATTYSVQMRFGSCTTWAEGNSPSLMGIVGPTQRFANWRAVATGNVPSQFGEWSNVQKVYCYGPATVALTYNLNDFVPEIIFDYAPVQDDPLTQCKVVFSYADLHGQMSKSLVFNGQYNQDGTYSMRAKLPVAPVVPIAVSVEGITKNNTVRGAILNIFPIGYLNPLGTAVADLVAYQPTSDENDDGILGLELSNMQTPFLDYNFTYNLYRSNMYTLETVKVAQDIQPMTDGGKTVFKDYSVEMGEDYIYNVGICREGRLTHMVGSVYPWDYTNPRYQKLGKMDSILLTTRRHQLRLQGNVNVSAYKRNTNDSFTNTIGSKYPFYQRSAQTNYRTMTINGVVSINFDKTATFMRYDPDNGLWWDDDNGSTLRVLNRDLFETSEFSVARRRARESGGGDYISTLQHETVNFEANGQVGETTIIGLQDKRDIAGPMTAFDERLFKDSYRDYNTNPTDRMVYVERKFRDFVMEWLSDGKPKLFRSETEGNMIVMLSGISFTPVDKSSRMVYSLSATVTEIAEYTLENLVDYNLVPTLIQSYTQDGNPYKFVPGERDLNVVTDLIYWYQSIYNLPDMFVDEPIAPIATQMAVRNAVNKDNVHYYSIASLLPPGAMVTGFDTSQSLVQALPNGLTIDEDTGVISGTPTTLNHMSSLALLTIKEWVTENGQQKERVAHMIVSVGRVFERLVFDEITEEIPFAITGEPIDAFSVADLVSGGIKPYTFSSNDLPDGIVISSDGVISGAYAMPISELLSGNESEHTATITVVDESGQTASRTILFGGANYPLSFTDSSAFDIDYTEKDQPMSPQVDVSSGVFGGIPAEGALEILFPTGYAYSAVGLPVGLRIESYLGTIGGTPTEYTESGGQATVTAYDMRFNESHARYAELEPWLTRNEELIDDLRNEETAYLAAAAEYFEFQAAIDWARYADDTSYQLEVDARLGELQTQMNDASANATSISNTMKQVAENNLEPIFSELFANGDYTIFSNSESIVVTWQQVLPPFLFVDSDEYNLYPTNHPDNPFQMGTILTPRDLMNTEGGRLPAVRGGLPFVDEPHYRFNSSGLLPDFQINNYGVISGTAQVANEQYREATIFAYDARGEVRSIKIMINPITSSLKFIPSADEGYRFDDFQVGEDVEMIIPMSDIKDGTALESDDEAPYQIHISNLPDGVTYETYQDTNTKQWFIKISGAPTENAITTSSRIMELTITDHSLDPETVIYKIYGGPVYQKLYWKPSWSLTGLTSGQVFTQYIGEVKYGKAPYSLTDVDDLLKVLGLRIVLNDENQSTNPSKIYITGTVVDPLPADIPTSIKLKLTDGFGDFVEYAPKVSDVVGALKLIGQNNLRGVQLVRGLSMISQLPILTATGGKTPYKFGTANGFGATISNGLIMDVNGLLSGQPTTLANTTDFTTVFKVTDASNPPVTVGFAEGLSGQWVAPQVVEQLLAANGTDYLEIDVGYIPINTSFNLPCTQMVQKTGFVGETFEIVSGQLPAGIEVLPDWSIGGLASDIDDNPRVVTLRATTPANTYTPAQQVTIVLKIAGVYGRMSYDKSPATLAVPGGIVGQPIAEVVVSNGLKGATEPVTWTVTNLPEGLTWRVDATNTKVCVITGTPTKQSAVRTATITVKDATNATDSIDITIGAFYGDFTFTDDPKFDVPEMADNNSITAIDFAPACSGGSGQFTFTGTGYDPYRLTADGILQGQCGSKSQAAKEATITAKDIMTNKEHSITIKIGAIKGSLSLDLSGQSIAAGAPKATATLNCKTYATGGSGTLVWMAEWPTTWPSGDGKVEISNDGVLSITRPSVSTSATTILVGVHDDGNQWVYSPLTIGATVGTISFTKATEHDVPAGAISTQYTSRLGTGLTGAVEPVTWTLGTPPTGWAAANFALDTSTGDLLVTRPATAVTAERQLTLTYQDAAGRSGTVTITLGIVTA